MFRKQGFLNIPQLLNFSIVKAKENFPKFDDEKRSEVFTKTREFSAFYTFRYLMEAAESFALFHPIKGQAEIDSEYLLGMGVRLNDHDFDKRLESLIDTKETIDEAISLIAPTWQTFSLNSGLVNVARRFRIFNLFRPRSKDFDLELFDHLLPFNGYAVLVDAERVDVAWKEIQDEFDKENAKREEKMDAKPQSHEETLRCLLQAFPHGKGNATWADVERTVGYSRRTIVRAMKSTSGQNGWAKAGQDD